MSTNPYISLSGPIYAWLYFATIMTTTLYGFTCMQTFFYYVHYENDLLRLRIFVTVIWALDTIHTVLIVAGTYKYIAGGNWPLELDLQIVVPALVAVLTQGFLMHRIYVFGGKRILTLLLWSVLSILQLAPSTKSLYSANGSLHAVDIIESTDSTIFKTTLALSLSAAAGQDILIAIFLVFLLVREYRDFLLPSTARMLQRLTVFAVNTGTWTATFALLSLVFLYILPSENLYILFAYPICSIYCNTVLANLNARSYLRHGSGVQHDSIDLLASATPFSDRQSKLVFSQPEAVPGTAELVTSLDSPVMSTMPECQV